MEGDLNILISLNTQFFHNDFDDDTKFGDSFHGELEGTANKDAEKVKTTLTRVCQLILRSSYFLTASTLCCTASQNKIYIPQLRKNSLQVHTNHAV